MSVHVGICRLNDFGYATFKGRLTKTVHSQTVTMLCVGQMLLKAEFSTKGKRCKKKKKREKKKGIKDQKKQPKTQTAAAVDRPNQLP